MIWQGVSLKKNRNTKKAINTVVLIIFGIAIIIGIAYIYAALYIFSTGPLYGTACVAMSGFSCDYASYANYLLNSTLAQTTGGTLYNVWIACTNTNTTDFGTTGGINSNGTVGFGTINNSRWTNGSVIKTQNLKCNGPVQNNTDYYTVYIWVSYTSKNGTVTQYKNPQIIRLVALGSFSRSSVNIK